MKKLLLIVFLLTALVVVSTSFSAAVTTALKESKDPGIKRIRVKKTFGVCMIISGFIAILPNDHYVLKNKSNGDALSTPVDNIDVELPVQPGDQLEVVNNGGQVLTTYTVTLGDMSGIAIPICFVSF